MNLIKIEILFNLIGGIKTINITRRSYGKANIERYC
jgi:hypothetical protein